MSAIIPHKTKYIIRSNKIFIVKKLRSCLVKFSSFPSRDRQGASQHAASVIFIITIRMIFSARSVNISKSFAKRLKFPSHANVRSTIHLLGNTAKVSLIFFETVQDIFGKKWT